MNNVRLQALLLQLTPVLQMVESAGAEWSDASTDLQYS